MNVPAPIRWLGWAMLACATACGGADGRSHDDALDLRVTRSALTFDQAAAWSWLAADQDADGGYGPTASSLATPVQTTAEVLRAMHAHARTSEPGFALGLQFVAAFPERNSEFLSRRIALSALAGQSPSALVSELFTWQNPDGGWGDRLGYGSSVLDTTFVLDALAGAGYGAGAQVNAALALVLQRQTGDGSWSDSAVAGGSTLLTARAILALAPFRGSVAGVAAAVTAGQNYLLARRNADGLWGETFVDAHVLLAFAATLADVTPVRASDVLLRSRQRADGSFEGDAYTTALVLQQVRAFDARLNGSTTVNASISGFVLRADSTEPIAGAVVSVGELPGVSVATDADGYYVIPGLPGGTYSLSASKPGFTSAGVSVLAASGSVTLAPALVLAVAADTGVLRGLVFDSATRAPLSGVQVSLAGPSSRSALSDGAGGFDFGPTAPGVYAISFVKDGYRSVSGSASVIAGEVLVAQLGLTLAGGFADSAPAPVRGRIVDGNSGDPIAGAQVMLAPELTATSNALGVFEIAAVPRGDYRGSVSAAGYRAMTLSLVFPAGATGELGELALFPASPQQAPTSLTLRGSVVDGVSGQPIAGAGVSLVETSAATSTDASGAFSFSGVTLMSFHLAVSAWGYVPGSYTLQVSAFGEANVVLRLSPPGGGATSSSFSGRVTAGGAPVAGADVRVAGTTLSATTDATGFYTLSGIGTLELTIVCSATGFRERETSVRLAAHGNYTLDHVLEAIPPASYQVVSVAPDAASWPGGATATFSAQVASLLDTDSSALVIGEIRNGAGTQVATLTPYVEGSSAQQTPLFAFAASELKSLIVPWPIAQQAPGQYRMILRVVVPGSINAAARLGTVLAESQTFVTVTPKRAFDGALAVTPPLVQAGVAQTVAFSALIRNAGNVPIELAPIVLTVKQAGAQTALFSALGELSNLAVGASVNVELGSWVPTTTGNLDVEVRAQSAELAGLIKDRLYVGDKADGTFTATPGVVAEGTQTVRGEIDLRGVDTTQGSSTDPLFALVKESVRRGALYTAPEATNWHRTNRCLGCHIQTQSLLGLSSALHKADVDLNATKFLYNAISTSQQADGALRISHPEFALTQTALALWSLPEWPDPAAALRTKVRAAQYLMTRKQRSCTVTFWSPDHATGWWNTNVSHTSLAVKGIADILASAAQLNLSEIPSYALNLERTLPGSGTLIDIAFGPGGLLYVLRGTTVTRVDLATGASTVVASGLPGGLQGLGIAPDGTVLVVRSSNPTLLSISPAGTRTDFNLGGSLADVVVAPDGAYLLSDATGRRILRRTPAGQVEVYASAGLLNRPWGLLLEDDGDLLVANSNGFNVLRIDPSRAVSLYVDGLAYSPLRLAQAGDGMLFVGSESGLLRARADGTAEAVLADTSLRLVAARDGAIFVAHSAQNSLNTLGNGSLASVNLTALRDELPFAARYFLSNYQDNSSDNTVHALRLIGLAEAKPHLADAALRAQIDTAVAFEDALIRARQRADGGWGRTTGSASDPLTTAMMGIALEYGSPSADDPKIRKTISYLLSTQRADGSWDNVNNGLTTRLASTSFVLVFMPKALDRLGGLDVDLRVELAANVQLLNPSIAPTSQSAGAAGGTSYLWSLDGVTGSGRNVEFDLRLLGMTLGEERPVATSATLAFENSFLAETIQTALTVPVVKTARSYELDVSTDKTAYGQSESVAIAPLVRNVGPTVGAGTVELAIETPGGALTIATLAPIAFADLAAGASRLLAASWFTADTLAGSYQVSARVLDLQGRVVDEAVAPFQIVAPAALAGSAVVTDRPVYEAWDVVGITGRARNLASNAVLPATQAELIVTGPTGATLLIEARDLQPIAQSGIVDLPSQLRLADAPSGTYHVTLLLHDSFTRELLSTSATTFAVERPATSGLAGEVVAAARQLYVGEPQSCQHAAWTVGAAALPATTLSYQLVAVEAGNVLQSTSQLVDLAGGGVRHPYTQSISTAGLAPGGYSCVLLAQSGGVSRPLAFAGFELLQPPIDLDASLQVGARGRLLVLLDPPSGDPHGPASAANTAQQRAFLEPLLRSAGWSFTIVTTPADFDREFATGRYAVYALHSEQTKLSEATQSLVRQAVFRGEGLMIAGTHDLRHDRFDEPLGITVNGAVTGANVVTLAAGGALGELGSLALLPGDKAQRIQLQTAVSLGRYEGSPGSGVCAPPGNGGDCHAVTSHGYGRGKTTFAAVDLLPMAARDGATSAAADLLLALLDAVDPVAPVAGAAPVVPVVLELHNQGVAVHTSVAISWSAGVTLIDPGAGSVSGTQLLFALDLAVNEVATRAFWVQLPSAAGSYSLQAAISALDGAVSWSGTTALALAAPAPESLTAIKARVTALRAAQAPPAQALIRAEQALALAAAASHPLDGVTEAVRAAEALMTMNDPQVVEVRVAIGLWLRWALQQPR